RDRVDANAIGAERRREIAHARLEARLGEAHHVVVRHHALRAEVGQREERAAKLYAETSCATANASRERPSRRSPASASRGAKAIECTRPSRPSHSRARDSNALAMSSSRVTSHLTNGAPAKSAASFTTRSFRSSFTYVKASAAPSRAQARAMPCAIERFERS